jgi:hypothetical protein
MGTKLVELFANRVDGRRNMINDYLRETACIESVRGRLILGGVDFELFLLISTWRGLNSNPSMGTKLVELFANRWMREET